MAVYGHRECKSEVEVVEKATFDKHTHGNISRLGVMKNVSEQKMLRTSETGKIVADNTINADLTVNGTLRAARIIGAVYA